MSKESWLAEFYPIYASHPEAKMRPITHSLRKWEGALVKNLKKHKIHLHERDKLVLLDAHEDEVLIFGYYQCALCMVHQENILFDNKCKTCPLFKLRGVKCFENDPDSTARYGLDSPYGIMSNTGDPKPMIRLLRKALKTWPEE